jgi:hypothetical protein
VSAFREKHFDQRLAHVGGLLIVHRDPHAVGDLHGAGRDNPAVDLDRTYAAGAQRSLALQVAQGGDVDARLSRDINKKSAFLRGDDDAVDVDLAAHLESCSTRFPSALG